MEQDCIFTTSQEIAGLTAGVPRAKAFEAGIPVLRPYDWDHIKNPSYARWYSAEFLKAFAEDTRIVLLQGLPHAPKDDMEGIGTRKLVCPFCDDERRTYVPGKGDQSGIVVYYEVSCICIVYMNFFYYWSNPKIVPPIYHEVTLGRLKPFQGNATRGYSMEKQQEDIAALKAHRDGSFFFTGPTGTGKTTMSIALFNAHLQQGSWEAWKKGSTTRAVWRVDTSILLDQMVAWYTRPRTGPEAEANHTPSPEISHERIQSAIAQGFRPTVFFEEFDKWKPTVFKTEQLFRLVNAVQEGNGRIVISSNRNRTSMEKFLDSMGTMSGSAILRRIADIDNGGFTIVTQGKKKSQKNKK